MQPESTEAVTPEHVVQAANMAIAGFGDATLVSANGLDRAIAMTFAADGRLFVTFQDGQIKIIKNIGTASQQVITAGSLTLCAACNDGERGLLGMTLDPNFPATPNGYVYYTTDSGGMHNRIRRFTASGDSISFDDSAAWPFIELETRSSDIHQGGALHFGNDGMLYVATGVENETQARAQSLTSTSGKILRFNKSGSIPTSNPFYNQTTGLNRAIWALGLRNPFTFAFRRTTGRMFINDVGSDKYEEINDGVAGANFNWPNNDTGSGALHRYSHGANNENCSINGGTFYDPAAVQFPSAWVGRYFFGDWCNHQIRYIDPANPTNSVLFASNVAGAPNPSGGGVVDLTVGPEGALYYLARGNGGVIGRITNTQGTAPSITQQPASLSVAPGQNAAFSVSAEGTAPLAYQWQRAKTNVLLNGDFASNTGANWSAGVTGASVAYSAGFADFSITTSNGVASAVQLRQNVALTAQQYTLCYDVRTDESPRTIAVATDGAADSNYALRGLNATGVSVTTSWVSRSHTFTAIADATARVKFNLGANTNDVQIDNVRLTTGSSCYNNISGATGTSYTLNGASNADNGAVFRATVTNSVGQTQSRPATLTVLSDSPPSATITAPTVGSTYTGGSTLAFSGTGTDDEDGNLPASNFTWVIDLYHDNHAHPAMPATSGVTSGTFNIATTGHTETNVWLRVTLTVRDSAGLTDTTFVDVNPRLVNLTLASQPTGLSLTLDGQPIVTPFVAPSVVGITRTIGATSPQTANSRVWAFSSWAHGGTQNQSFLTPTSNTTYTAQYTECTTCATGAWVSAGTNTVTAAGWSEDTFAAVTTDRMRFCLDEGDMIEVMEVEARNSGTRRTLTLSANTGGLSPVANLTDNSTTTAATVATVAGQYKCVEYSMASSTINSARVYSDFAGNWKLDRWRFEYWDPNATP